MSGRPVSYVYEVREDGAVTATGRLTLDVPAVKGELVRLGRVAYVVEEIVARVGEARLVLRGCRSD